MAFALHDRVRETTETTGTGTVTLAGAVTGYRTFASVFADADTTHYLIESGSAWEIGLGTLALASPWTLARTTVLASSSSGSRINLGVGSKTVSCVATAALLDTIATLDSRLDDAESEIGSLQSTDLSLSSRITALEGGGGTAGRLKLTGSRTYHVNDATGSDSNNGLSSGAPFLTLQKALNVIMGLDGAGYSVTVSVADGTYAGFSVASSPLNIPSLTIESVNGPASTEITGRAEFVRGAGTDVTLEGFKFSYATSGGEECVRGLHWGGLITLTSCEFGANTAGAHISCTQGRMLITGDHVISGDALSHLSVSDFGYLEYQADTSTVDGTPDFALAFASCYGGHMLIPTTTWTGSATGVRYDVARGGVIDAEGQTLPGDTAGTTATGGAYF